MSPNPPPRPSVELTITGLHPGQREIAASGARFRVVCAGRRFGKALALDTPIPTPDGWRTMADIQAGDYVFSDTGETCAVTGVSPVQTDRDCFEVVFSDGSVIVADADHLWTVWPKQYRKWLGDPGHFRERQTPLTLTTREMLGSLRKWKEVNYAIPVCGPLRYAAKELALDPYVLGVWLGDGSTNSAEITSVDQEIVGSVAARVEGEVRMYHHPNRTARYGIGVFRKGAPEGRTRSVSALLGALGLLGNKHIPRSYLESSVDQRRALLAGLMDTDGSVTRGGHCEYMTTREALGRDAMELVVGLGYKATLKEERATLYGKDCGPRWRITFTPDEPVFLLSRKADVQRSRIRRALQTRLRYVVDIRPCPSVPVKCIAVDSPSRLYLAGRSCIPTHNTRLAVALAIHAAADGKRVWWVAPSYKLASVGWRDLRHFCGRIPGAEVSLSNQMYTLPGGGWIQVRTAGAEGALRGEGLDLVIYDEAAQGPEASWTDELRPALADRKGAALFISTPRGRGNWFHNLWLRGNGDDPEWQSWQFPSVANPFIDPAEIEVAREDMPAAVADQEFDATFNDAGAGPFNPVDIEAMRDGWAGLSDPIQGRQYMTAWDIGRRGDPSVGITVDYSTVPYQVVAFSREHRQPYPVQQAAIAARAVAYRDKPIIESNGPGDPVIENLDCRADAFVTTARSKQQALAALTMLLERGAIKADIPELTREMHAYQWDDKGLVQDCVMALAILALHLPSPDRKTVTLDFAAPPAAYRPETAGLRDVAF